MNEREAERHEQEQAKHGRTPVGRPLGELKRKKAEGEPLLRVQEGQEILSFFRRKDHVVKRIVGQIGVRRTEYRYDAHASSGATESEGSQDILAGVPVAET